MCVVRQSRLQRCTFGLSQGLITGAARQARASHPGASSWQRLLLRAALIKVGLRLDRHAMAAQLSPVICRWLSSSPPHIFAVCSSTDWLGSPGDGKNTPVC